MGPKPLSMPTILCYLDLIGVSSNADRLQYLQVIKILDSVLMEDIAKRLRSKTTPSMPSGGKPRLAS